MPFGQLVILCQLWPAELIKTCNVLHGAAQHQVLSVRIAVLSTVANLADGLRHQQAPLQACLVPVLKGLTAGSSPILVYTEDVDACTIAVMACVQGGQCCLYTMYAPPFASSSPQSQQHLGCGHDQLGQTMLYCS